MSTTGTVLDSIIAGVRDDLAQRRRELPLRDLEQQVIEAAPARDALAALRGDGASVALIAEVKRSSPSKGRLSDIPDPAQLAAVYASHGARAISVLTEQRRFGGSLTDLDAVRARVEVPVLRKDFLVDPYQVLEARAHGADLVLLIVAALSDAQLNELYSLVRSLDMHALVEIHEPAELDRALAVDPTILGVNARDLRTLDVDAAGAARTLATVPPQVLAVGESAVARVDDVRAYAAHGADAVLVGEALVTAADPADAVTQFSRVPRTGRTRSTRGGGTV